MAQILRYDDSYTMEILDKMSNWVARFLPGSTKDQAALINNL